MKNGDRTVAVFFAANLGRRRNASWRPADADQI
jgi:hypothetical protein